MSSTDVFEAAAAGDLAHIKSFGRIHLEAKNDRGWTPLMFAARYGHAALVEYLLAEAKVDPSTVNKDGKTAAELADFWGSMEAVAVFDRLAPNKKRVQQTTGSPFAATTTNGSVITKTEGDKTGEKKSSIADWWKRRTVHETKPLHFTGAIHNRSSFLRTDKEYLQASIRAPSTRFILLAGHGVLFKSSTKELAYVNHDDIQHLIGPDPLDSLPEGLVLVFLGVNEAGLDQPQHEGEVLVHGRRGVAYWALDVSARSPGVTKEQKDSIEALTNALTEKHGHYMAEMRPAAFGLPLPESGLLAQARSVVDWNRRNLFCPGCGRKNLSLEGGHKRACPPTIGSAGNEVPSDCLAHNGVQNFTYPRTGK
ncbi:NADH pyrophosphatase [Haplosporangium sp. Z 767]|nr:NADH pyrophosphatase [Haplosporangium sp. Z 767]